MPRASMKVRRPPCAFLEGSVRRQGQRVRITAQLIHAGNDGHVWSESYDRELTDIFQVQEEIARAITSELEGILGKRQVSVTASTDNIEAYQNFLRGRTRFHRRDELPQAIEDLSKAVEQDPDFADAWIYLAATWFVAPGYFGSVEVQPERVKTEARASLQRAAALAPEHAMVLALEGQLRGLEADQIGALALLEQASKLSVHDSNPMMWRGMLLLQTGYVDEAIAVLEQARSMDPLAGINNGYLAIAYLSAGRDTPAEATARRAEALGSGHLRLRIRSGHARQTRAGAGDLGRVHPAARIRGAGAALCRDPQPAGRRERCRRPRYVAQAAIGGRDRIPDLEPRLRDAARDDRTTDRAARRLPPTVLLDAHGVAAFHPRIARESALPCLCRKRRYRTPVGNPRLAGWLRPGSSHGRRSPAVQGAWAMSLLAKPERCDVIPMAKLNPRIRIARTSSCWHDHMWRTCK